MQCHAHIGLVKLFVDLAKNSFSVALSKSSKFIHCTSKSLRNFSAFSTRWCIN